VAVGAAVVIGGGSGSGSNDGATASAANAGTGNVVGYGQFPGGGGGFPGGMGTAGTVSAIDGSTLTVTGQDDTETTVKTTDDTTVTRTSEGELSDLAVGDNVVVMGETDGDAVAAQTITDSGDQAATTTFRGPGGGQEGTPPSGAPDGSGEGQAPPDGQGFPGGQGGMPTAGEITKIDGGTITVKTADGTIVTVTTSDDTTVSVTEEIEVSDIAEGDTVVVMGETADDVVTADAIRVGDLGAGGFRMNGGTPPQGMPGGSGGPSSGSGSGSGDTTTVTGT